MPNLKAIKKRITSVKSTQKITRAMKLVSAAKLKKAQERAQRSRPFERQLMDMVWSTLYDAKWDSPLSKPRDVKRTCLIVFTSDRGLCGSLNSNVIKTVQRRVQELKGAPVEIIGIGRRGADFFRRRGLKIHSVHSNMTREGTPETMAKIAATVREAFVSGYFDSVEVFYPHFKSAIAQKPTQVVYLPFIASMSRDAGMCLYEPHPQALLDKLVPMLLDFQMYRFLLETTASEHAARMAAMESATKNSKEMIERLTLERNRARQAIITKELMEIIGGAEAISA